MADAFLDVVTPALNYLYSKGKSGFWSDPRTTSEVVLALVAAGETFQSEYLKSAGEYILAHSSPEVKGISWASELWDTSLAVRALNHVPANTRSAIDRAFDWIESKKFPDGSYDGEPWDTLFAALASLENGREAIILSTGTADWLCSLQTVGGALISPHYTGLLCEVLEGVLRLDMPQATRGKLKDARIRALLHLTDVFEPSNLWGPHSWGNAYVLYAVAATRQKALLDQWPAILSWFREHQNKEGAWDDVVRTAIVVGALCRTKISYEISRFEPLQPLSSDVYVQSLLSGLSKSIQTRIYKPELSIRRPFIAREESGTVVVTITHEREMYIALFLSMIALGWEIFTNWQSLRFLFRR